MSLATFLRRLPRYPHDRGSRRARGPQLARTLASRRLSFAPRLEALEDRLAPAAWAVTTTADTGAGFANSGDLRYCINQANADPDS
jgi:hypothetical protein